MPRGSLADRVEEILRSHSKGAPIHYRELTRFGIEDGLIVPGGATPEASLNAAITQDMKRRQSAGEAPRFRSHGGGLYALARPRDPLDGAIGRRNSDVRRRLRELLGEMHPRDFEALIGELLVAIGFEDVEVTRYVGDKGIDLRARLAVGGVTDVKTAIQVKRFTEGSVGGPVVQQLRGGLGPHERGLMITLSRFSKAARQEALEPDRSPISLVDGDELIELLIENKVGVTSTPVPIVEVDEAFFAGESEDGSDGVDGGESSRYNQVFRSPSSSGKVLTLWPMPGGISAWKQSLDTMLQHIADDGPTMQDAISWVIATFDRVESKKTARGYWQVLRSFGLIESQGEQVTVTRRGASYLANPTDEALLEISKERIVGVPEMLAWLGEGPLGMDEILTKLNDALDVGWESTAQVQFRLGWLLNIGVVENTAGNWSLRP